MDKNLFLLIGGKFTFKQDSEVAQGKESECISLESYCESGQTLNCCL